MDAARVAASDVIAPRAARLATVDDGGVTFRSHIDGSKRRLTPESSMAIQHDLGADIIFAFDECTTLLDSRAYQETSLARTNAWAKRCLDAHRALTDARSHLPYQALYGVVQGAQYEDLRRAAARELANMSDDDGRGFDGFGLGGALEKENLGRIVGWMCDELPDERPRHLLGIADVEDLFEGIAAGADTFDCVAPTRTARHGAAYTPSGPVNLKRAGFKRDFAPIDADCDCQTCAHYSRAYLCHLLRAREINAATLLSIHNVRFIIRLVSAARAAIIAGDFDALQTEVVGRYRSGAQARQNRE
jgi:queuine tRNA-ribosyltransferase